MLISIFFVVVYLFIFKKNAWVISDIVSLEN